jgi:hypothetical protein
VGFRLADKNLPLDKSAVRPELFASPRVMGSAEPL